MNPLYARIAAGILRALIAALGGAGLISDGEIEQLAGIVLVAGSIGWSAWQKYQAQRAMN